jgi:ABC-2 type transport system permease protein
MKALYIIVAAAVVLSLRFGIPRFLRARRAGRGPANERADNAAAGTSSANVSRTRRVRIAAATENSLGDVGMVAMREIRERIRGRILKVGTLIMLIAVAAAIIIPSIHSTTSRTVQTVGVVGSLSPEAEQIVKAAGSRLDDSVKFVRETSVDDAKAGLRSDKIDIVVVDGNQLLLNEPASSQSSPADPSFVQEMAAYLGLLKAYHAAGLTPAQAAEVTHAKPLPVGILKPTSKSATKTTSVIGLVLLFFMLTQYCTWILIGVMQEKSSRVVEVLLATLRPIQLLGGKVLGIGLVALGQASLILGFAFIVGEAVGSNLLHGAAPLVLVCELLWLVLGYAFYCWVYAAAGSTAERQDQIQTLALPLSLPILLGYVFSITVASSGNADVLFKVLAYVPLTAPFCMPVLVGLGEVTWWEFLASVLITIAATAGMAVFAARIYRRAVLRTGGRVRIRELLARSSTRGATTG